MKRLFALSLATVLALPVLTASEAQAHPAPFPHYHPKVKRRAPVYYVPPRRAVIVRPAPRVYVTPPRPVVVHHPTPVVVRPAPEPTVVVQEQPQKKQRARTFFGLGVHATTQLLNGDKIGIDPGENGVMGGFGLRFKTRFGRHWGLELTAEWMTGSKEDYSQTTIPVMAGVSYHFLPQSRIQPFIMGGVGVHFTTLEYLDGRYKFDMTEVAGQLGAGVEWFITRWLSLQADLRFQTVFKNLETKEEIRQDCLVNSGGMTGFCDNIHGASSDEKMNIGLQVQLGANIYF